VASGEAETGAGPELGEQIHHGVKAAQPVRAVGAEVVGEEPGPPVLRST